MEKIKRKKPLGKKLTIAVAVFGLIPAISVITVGILYLTETIDIVAYEPNHYEVCFYSDEDTVFQHVYRRGEELDEIENPHKEADSIYRYTFIGWDLNGDKLADNLPKKVYFSIYAYAIYNKTRLHK